MLRSALVAAILVVSLTACSDTPSSERVGVAGYGTWARARATELSTLIGELEAHMLAANREPGLHNEQPWRDRAEVLINATIAVVAAVRAWQTVPPEAAAVHQQLLEIAGSAETMVVNAGQAISLGDAQYANTAINAKLAFEKAEPDFFAALTALEASASGQ